MILSVFHEVGFFYISAATFGTCFPLPIISRASLLGCLKAFSSCPSWDFLSLF